MSRHLLPPNLTPLEAALADSLALSSDPTPIRTLWDADRCPIAQLPWLAWALSVEGWESAISEQQQRELVRNAIPTHRRKGTPASITAALAAIGIDARINDQRSTATTPHTFEVEIDLHDRGLDDATRRQIEDIVAHYKNVRSHPAGLRISLTSKGAIFVGAAAWLGDELTVYPYTPAEIVVTGTVGAGGAVHIIDTMSIYP